MATFAPRTSLLLLTVFWGCTDDVQSAKGSEPSTTAPSVSSTATVSVPSSAVASTPGTAPEPVPSQPMTLPTPSMDASTTDSSPAPPVSAAESSSNPTASSELEPSAEASQPPPVGTDPQTQPTGSAAGGSGEVPPQGSAGAPQTDPPDTPEPRTQCPEAPPAAEKAPAADRSLAVSKDDYSQLIDAHEPFEGTRGALPYHLYEPEQADPEELLPLLVVLHGGYGREVTDGNILVDVAQYLLGSANGLLTQANLQEYPTFILAPHCRVEEGCNFGSNEWASTGGANFQVLPEPSVAGGTALELIEHVIESYAIDPARVYLTGNSMGGGGTWEFAQRRPDLFAAVVPVSGHTPNQDQLLAIADAKLPVWAFGAQNDSTNPYTDTVAAIEALTTAGGCAWLTTYQNAGHDDALWSSPYLEPGLWPWLFAQSNP